MDIYETLNYISKLAFPKIKYTWENWSINGEKPIFQISIVSNKIEDYIEDYYEKGLGAILKVIESNSLSSEEEYYAKQLLVVLADHAINYHSDICKNKPEIACKLYKKNGSKWNFVCSLPVPDTEAEDTILYDASADYSSYIGSGTYRIYTTFNADGHSISRYSNTRTF